MTNLNGKVLKTFIKKVAYIWSGVCLILIGIVGIVLPVLPGIIFVFLGIVLLSKGSSRIKNAQHIRRLFKISKDILEKSPNIKFKSIINFF